MHYYPSSIRKLIKQISKLPGIGEKTAERLALHILRTPFKEAEALSGAILGMKETVRFCGMCYALSDGDICTICADPARDAASICVVEQPGDMIAIEKSGSFNGRYHILQGALSPIEGVGPDNIRIRELVSKIEKGGVEEVVLATGTSVEGEATASYIADQLRGFPIRVSRIASGVPIGGDLKYVDQVTMKRALDTRHPF